MYAPSQLTPGWLSQGGEKVDDVAGATKQQQAMQAAMANASIGYAKMNICHPPSSPEGVKYSHGSENARPINPSQLAKLIASVTRYGAAQWTEPINVVVRLPWIDMATVQTTPDVPWLDIPEVKFTDHVQGQTIQFLGGGHRSAAAREITKKFVDQADKLRQTIASLQDATGSKPLNQETNVQIAQLREKLDARQASADNAPFWLVRLIDAGGLTEVVARE